MNRFIGIILMIGSSLTVQANAELCPLQWRDDITLTPQQVVVERQQQPLWRFHQSGQLWLQQTPRALNAETQQVFQRYHRELYQQAKATALLIADAKQLARRSMGQIETELGGADAGLGGRLASSFARLEQRLAQFITVNDQQIVIYGSRLAGGNMVNTLEQELQLTMTELTAQLMFNIGQTTLQSGGSLQHQMARMQTELARLRQKLQQDVAADGKMLKQRGESICQQILQLAPLEQQLVQAVPELRGMTLLSR